MGGRTEEELLDAFTRRKGSTEIETNLSVFIPEDGNIYHDGFATIAGCALTHSPQKKAEMLYEGICAREGDSKNAPFKFDNIYITGGFDTGEVIAELEKIIQENGPLPKRKDNLKVFGFSDASQLHHYLGQRGIATEMYYSADVHCLAWDLAENKQIEPIQLTAVNDRAKEIKTLTGYTQPGSQVCVESSKTHQTALFDDNNILIVEFRRADKDGTEEIKRFTETISKFDKPLTLVLSKDSSKEATKVLNELLLNNKKLKNVPMFIGAPVGHGACMKSDNARAIPLFAKTNIKRDENGRYEMIVSENASDRVKEISLSGENRRKEVSIKTEGPTTRDIFIEGEAGSAGVIISNLEHIERNATEYHIHLPKDRYPIQMIKGTINQLIEKGIMDKEKIKNIVFDSDYKLSKEELANAQTYYMAYLKKRFVNPPNIDYTTAPNIPSEMQSIYQKSQEATISNGLQSTFSKYIKMGNVK